MILRLPYCRVSSVLVRATRKTEMVRHEMAFAEKTFHDFAGTQLNYCRLGTLRVLAISGMGESLR